MALPSSLLKLPIMVTLFSPEKLSWSFSYLQNPLKTATLLIQTDFFLTVGDQINGVPLPMIKFNEIIITTAFSSSKSCKICYFTKFVVDVKKAIEGSKICCVA